jgi:uncharacterized protein
MSTETNESTPASPAKWRPLSPRQRRVIGVLIEKAKTTPDAYPLTVNAIVAGSNQKSNRSPIMNLEPEDVEDILIELREMSAVIEVQSGGRVPRYKHLMYEWLGVEKVELAVMAELLLRGEQTIGELRGHVARMDPVPDLNALRPVLQSLMEKKLVMALSPEGRGQVVTHTLYKDRELGELRNRYAGGGPAPASLEQAADEEPADARTHRSSQVTSDMFAELQLEVAELRAELARLRDRLAALES